MPSFTTITVPPGERIRGGAGGKIEVPDRPILPYIEGDGTGPDIWRASQAVFDAAVAKAYGNRRKVAWMEVFAGEKAFNRVRTGCPRTPSLRSRSSWSASRGRSPRPSAAASARST
jgi:isocitrate dehydrogenase